MVTRVIIIAVIFLSAFNFYECRRKAKSGWSRNCLINHCVFGVSINLEEALGLNTSVLAFRGELGYNFGKRRRSTFRFGYFGLYRSASKVLESDIEIGDKFFPDWN